MTTLSVVEICGNEKEFIKENLESIIPIANEIVIVFDERKVDSMTESIVDELQNKHKGIKWKVTHREWDTGAQQKQFAFEQATQEWVLFLDSDEVLNDDAEKLLGYIGTAGENGCNSFSIKGHHLIYHLGFEDNTYPEHHWNARLIKNNKRTFKFTGINHAILEGVDVNKNRKINDVRIFHLGYVKHLDKIMMKYHIDNSIKQLHNPQFMEWWKNSHILGQYPVKSFDVTKLPSVLKKKFCIEYIEDAAYFQDRMNLEPKFYEDAITWKDYFKPKKVLLCGCGAGQRVYTLERIGVQAYGFDKSKYIIDNCPFPIKQKLWVNDIVQSIEPEEEFDLVVCYDILEHLEYENLDKTLENVYKAGRKDYLFSIPFIGDPNLDADPTHVIKESKSWWFNKLQSAGFKLKSTPNHFQFKEQIIIAEK